MQHYPLVRVTSLHALMLEIADVDVPPEAGEKWWRGDLPDLTYQNLEGYAASNKFDTLIIDEAQDIGTPEYLLILDALLEGGLKKLASWLAAISNIKAFTYLAMKPLPTTRSLSKDYKF